MKTIELTRGKVAYCDEEDYEFVSKQKWCYLANATGYAVTRFNGKVITMHKYLLNPPKGMDVDHLNGNGLDNRRSNIRICTRMQNRWNIEKLPTNTSGFKGVYWRKDRKRYEAFAYKNNKRYSGGYFKDIEDAHQAQIKLSIKLHGEFSGYYRSKANGNEV
jgi:hypothetical protein